MIGKIATNAYLIKLLCIDGYEKMENQSSFSLSKLQNCVFTVGQCSANLSVKINPERRTVMIRRTKGMKRYAKQREKQFTDNLIREDELARMAEVRGRLSRTYADFDDENKKEIKGRHPR